MFFTPFVAQAFMSERSSEIEPCACPTIIASANLQHRPFELDKHFGNDHRDCIGLRCSGVNAQIVSALDYISGRLARDEKALELAYDVIKLLETDDLVYTQKGMVVGVC